MTKKCMIIGYLPQEEESHPFCQNIKQKLRQEIFRLMGDGYRVFYTGLQPGVEMWGAEIVLEFSAQYKNLKVVPVLVDEECANHWEEDLRERYFDHILPHVEDALYATYQHEEESMDIRNRLMLQRSVGVLAIFEEEPTDFWYQQAKDEEKQVIFWNPRTCDEEI